MQLFLILPGTIKWKFLNILCVIKPIFMKLCCYSVKLCEATSRAGWLEDEQFVSTAIFVLVNREPKSRMSVCAM